MNKKATRAIICIAVIALIAAAAVWGRNYYQDRYVSADYYAFIPADYDVTPVMQYADGGAEMGLGVDFNLTAYNAEGESKEVGFTVYDPSSDFNHGERIPPAGTYLLVKASKQIVTGWSVAVKEQIPAAALSEIEKTR